MGELRWISRQPVVCHGAALPGFKALLVADVWSERRLRGGNKVFQRAETIQADGEYGRRKVVGMPSCLHHAPAIDARGTIESRRNPGNDPVERGHRAYRRHYRRSGSGTRQGDGMRAVEVMTRINREEKSCR